MQDMTTLIGAQELTQNEIDEVSGGLIFLAAALGVVTGGAAAAAGIWLWEKYN